MKIETFPVAPLLGLQRNRAATSVDEPLRPQRLFNLSGARGGGYTPRGAVATKEGVVLPEELIGYDFIGYSSFIDGLKIKLFDGDELHESELNYEPGIAAGFSHIPAFGAYRAMDGFFGFDDELNPIEPLRGATPLEIVSASGGEEELFTIATLGGSQVAFYDAASDGARIIASVRENPGEEVDNKGHLYRSTDQGETWSSVLSQEDDDGELEYYQFRRIATDGNGIWVAVGRNHTARSTDNGDNWTLIDPGDNGIPSGAADGGLQNGGFYSIFCDPDTGHFYATTNIFDGSNAGIYRSTDGGLNWTRVEGGASRNTAFVKRGDVLYAFPHFPVGHSGGLRQYFTSEDGVNWTAQEGFSTLPTQGAAEFEGDIIVGVRGSGDTGGIYYSSDGATWAKVFDSGVVAVAHNPQSEVWFALVGHTTTNGLLQSRDGQEWEGEAESGEQNYGRLIPFGTYIARGHRFEYDTEPFPESFTGHPNAARLLRQGSALGLEAGDYTVFHLATLPTRAGDLVVDLGRRKVVFSGSTGNTITVTAPSVADIQAEADWTVPSEVAEKVRFDVYLMHETTEIEDPVAVFAARLEPDETKMIDRLPRTGRVLGVEGFIATIAFDSTFTITHNERVWGILAKDPLRFHMTIEDEFLEAISAPGGVVLGYSETGYVNLMRADNYLTIIPTQSSRLNGLLSIPGSILALFDNEALSIQGDPALDGLRTDPFPDMLGCDVDTLPARQGGIGFAIFKGEVYAITGGGAENVSAAVWRPDDPFEQVIPCHSCPSAEVHSGKLAFIEARTRAGSVMSFDASRDFWYTPSVSATLEPDMLLLPHIDKDGTRYSRPEQDVMFLTGAGDPETPVIDYYQVDFGEKQRRDKPLRVLVSVEGYEVDEADPPRLYYRMSPDHEGLPAPTWEGHVFGRQRSGSNRINFVLPGNFRANRVDFRLELRKMPFGAVLEAPIHMIYAPGFSRV